MKTTFAVSVANAQGQSWKLSSHWTKKVQSLQVSDPSNWLGSWTFVWRGGSGGGRGWWTVWVERARSAIAWVSWRNILSPWASLSSSPLPPGGSLLPPLSLPPGGLPGGPGLPGSPGASGAGGAGLGLGRFRGGGCAMLSALPSSSALVPVPRVHRHCVAGVEVCRLRRLLEVNLWKVVSS